MPLPTQPLSSPEVPLTPSNQSLDLDNILAQCTQTFRLLATALPLIQSAVIGGIPSYDLRLTDSHQNLPTPFYIGDTPAIKIDENEYQKAVKGCIFNLIGRLILPKGSQPFKTADLFIKLKELWKLKKPWKISPLGKGFFCLQFSDHVDQQSAWTSGLNNLNPGFLKLSLWSTDFIPEKFKQTNSRVWVRLHFLPIEYWQERILLSIATTIGSPIKIDPSTLNRTFCLYARVQVDVDLQYSLPQKILVERENFSFEVPVSYERIPDFCTHCATIGHFVGECRALRRVQGDSGNASQVKEPKHKKQKTYVSNVNTEVPPFVPPILDQQNITSDPHLDDNVGSAIKKALNEVFGPASPPSSHSPILSSPSQNSNRSSIMPHTRRTTKSLSPPLSRNWEDLYEEESFETWEAIADAKFLAVTDPHQHCSILEQDKSPSHSPTPDEVPSSPFQTDAVATFNTVTRKHARKHKRKKEKERAEPRSTWLSPSEIDSAKNDRLAQEVLLKKKALRSSKNNYTRRLFG